MSPNHEMLRQAGGTYIFLNHETLGVVMATFSLFMFFKNINIGSNKIINAISRTSFAVYLIHDNNLIRSKLWGTWIKTGAIKSPIEIIIIGILCAIIVYAVCSLIEWIRILCVERPLFSLVDRVFGKYFAKFDSCFNADVIKSTPEISSFNKLED